MIFGKAGIVSFSLLSASLLLSACSDPDFADMCAASAAEQIPKGAEISVSDKKVTKQGLSATVTLKITAAFKRKDKDDKLSFYRASCIIKGDRVARAFLRPASS
ncbi:MAG: hypothetical protein HN884_02660 [Rhodospirillaceae bacterium]|jgi:hypothetical protein|nr:hypothetical protein [Rhodospirillaceae bacterium]MBT7265750.1 hypothetical protein [Rhodospirillaceae bacterium]